MSEDLRNIRLPTKEATLRYLRKNGLEVRTILDVGVKHETEELKKVFPEVKHFLFEPVEEYFPHIEENYRGFDHVLIKAALSDSDGKDELTVRKLSHETITHSSLGDHISTGDSVERRLIDTFTLDTVMKKHAPRGPYLLKLDVDGHEMSILQGAEETLKKCSCIVIEAALCYLAERASFLTERGFHLWDIVDLCYYYNNLHQVDLIFLNETEKNKAPFAPFQHYEFKWEEWKDFSRCAVTTEVKKAA